LGSPQEKRIEEMSQRRLFRIIIWIFLAVCLLFVASSSPALANLRGSLVTFAPSIEYETGKTSASCYIPGGYQTLCFNLDTTSPDGQDADSIAIQFPTDWEVYGRWMGDHYDYTSIEHSCTNEGTMAGALSWSGFARDGQYLAGDNRVQNEGTSCHALYCFTVTDATDPGDPPYDDELDAMVSWSWAGGAGAFPQSVCSSDSLYPQDGFPCDEVSSAPPATVPVCEYVPLTIMPETLPVGEAVTYYTQQFTAQDPDGNVLPNDQVWWSVPTSELPINCSIYSNTGKLECYSYYNDIPLAAGTYDFTLAVESINSWGSGSRDYTLVINPLLLFDPETLPYARLNQPFTQLITVSDGTGPYTLTHTAGTLPAGITFDEDTDSFTGTPTELGTFDGIVVQAVDANGVTKTHTYSLTVLPEHLFTWTPLTPTSGEATAFTADEGFDTYIWHYASQPGGECDSEVWNGGSRFANINFYGKGDHKVCLELIDYSPDYIVLNDEQWVTVTNSSPRVDSYWIYPDPSFPGQQVEADAYFYDYDGPGIFTCEIDWGDGTTDTVFSEGESWQCSFPPHAYSEVGIYQTTLSVTDDEGAMGEKTLEHQVVYLYGEGGETRLASNTLPTTITLYGFAPEGTESIDFSISTGPEHGSMGVPSFINCESHYWLPQAMYCRATVVFTPQITDPLYVGSDSFAFTLSDSGGHTSEPVTVDLWLDENEPPTADDGTAVVNASEPSQFAIFGADMDTYDYSVDELSFHIDTPPEFGSLQFEGDAEVFEWLYDGDWNLIGAEWSQLITYIPDPGTTATTDTFTFHINDSHQDSNIATETLTLHTPTTLHVNVNDDVVDVAGCDETHCSLREAVADAQVGDTIDFTLQLPNMIVLTWDGGGELLINKNIQILGPGADQLSISAGFEDPEMNPEDGFRVFHIFDDYWPMEATISGLTIRDGRSSEGGGIFVDEVTTLNLSDCVIGPNNIVSYAGGGIAIEYADVTMENCTVIGNEGTGTMGGAGIFIQYSGTLDVINSTITGNITNNYGGGLLAYSNSEVSLINSTISGNIANQNYETEPWGGGGGIYNYEDDSTIKLQNTIVAGNTDLTELSEHASWPDVEGSFISLGGNLIGDETGSTGWLPSDMVGTAAAPIDPLLGTFGIYEPGTTPTYPLLEGSPAIDTAVCAVGVTTDQRGVKRPQGIACDRGAFEVENPLTYLFMPMILR
jgi:hypothetical protein